MNTQPEIAYILKGYPRASETFINNEIYLLEQMGLKLRIYAIKQEREETVHHIVEQIKAPVTYLPEATELEEGPFRTWLRINLPHFIGSHWQLFLKHPSAYLKTLFYVLFELCLHFPFGKAPTFKKSLFKDFVRAGAIAWEIAKAGNVQHLHGHFCHGSTTMAMLASHITGIPFSFTAHAKDVYVPKLNPNGLLATKIEEAQFVTTCTDANRTYMEQLCPHGSPIHTVYHGLDTTYFAPPANRGDAAAKPTILAVGRFVKKKGFPYLVKACALLAQRGVNFHCRIIGPKDEDSPKVQQLVDELQLGDLLTIEGGMSQEGLRQAYADAALFTIPCLIADNGDRDGIPNVMAEAMATGLPVVASNISGIPELVQDGVNGLLVPQQNVEALADALEKVLRNEALRIRLGTAARQTICAVFDSHETTRFLYDLFVDCLQKRGVMAVEAKAPTQNAVKSVASQKIAA